ncbi:CTD small phosphatase-like protein 2 isoform 4-T4 [Chlamydotis macqueenii]
MCPMSLLGACDPWEGLAGEAASRRGASQAGTCSPLFQGKGLVPTVPAPGRGGLWKTHSMLEHTLILELDGTLVCSSMLAGQWWGAGATFTTTFQGDAYEVHVKLHPHQILESLSKIYEIFIFTTVKQDYAEKVLDVLDPKKKLIRYCFSQRDCLCARGFYWKDLTCLGRDLAKTVALDHTIQSFPAQILAALALVGGCQLDPSTEVGGRLVRQGTTVPHCAAGAARLGGEDHAAGDREGTGPWGARAG